MTEDEKRANRSEISRENFFGKIVHLEVWKDSLSGRNEEKVKQVIESLGYVFGKDFVRQHPIAERYVLDFAFVNEMVAIEVDGKNHESKKHRKKDLVRDRYLRTANWVTVRIPESKFFAKSGSFYKNLIREVVEERRSQYETGKIYQIDFKRFHSDDYEYR